MINRFRKFFKIILQFLCIILFLVNKIMEASNNRLEENNIWVKSLNHTLSDTSINYLKVSANSTEALFRPYNSKKPSNNHISKPKIVNRPTEYYDSFKGNDFLNAGSFKNHACRRICQPGKVMTCYYQLIVHNYQRLGSECRRCQADASACEREHCIFGDGIPNPVIAVNAMVPGPPIELCQNDTVVVDVVNYLLEPLTIHWHGIAMTQTPDMDGAPYVTQYPIQPGEIFRYKFPAERSGTVWYHSHLGWQRALGVAGGFVIRQTQTQNRQAFLYDYDIIEHTLIIQDIFYNYDFNRVRNILINGKGRNHLSAIPDNDSRNRYERLRVTYGYRYRMRVISNGVSDCPIEFSIENHKLLMIATDGNDIAPIDADSFFMSSAERFDFVLEANQFASNYWIRVRGYGNCSLENLYQGAVLHYSGAARNANPFTNLFDTETERNIERNERVIVNQVLNNNLTIKENFNEKATNIAIASLRALTPLPWSPYANFFTYYTSLGSGTLMNGETVYQIDDITFELPAVSLLQARNLYNENDFLCNRSSFSISGKDCLRENCAGTNVIQLPAFRPIEFVVANYMETTHPVHMHGYIFRVVGQGIIGNLADLRRIQDLDHRGILQRLPLDFPAVEKDTIQVPGLGYVIIRFLSNNPGYWLYHCHIEIHSLRGMTAVLKFGEDHQIKRTPPKIRC